MAILSEFIDHSFTTIFLGQQNNVRGTHVHCLYFVQAVAAMVEECCKFVDQMPNLDTKLKLIDTLRTVSEGKVGYNMSITHVGTPSTYGLCL